MSDHDDIRELIAERHVGELSEIDRLRLETHLAECADCRSWDAECRALLGDLKSIVVGELDAHPSHEQLAQYTSSPEALSDQERAQLDLHLEICEACERDVRSIRELERDLAFDSTARARQARPRGRWTAIFARPVVGYSLAAVLLLMFIVPAMLLWRDARLPSPTSETGQDAAGSIQPHDREMALAVPLAEQTRSSQARRSITLEPGQEHLVLSVAFLPDPSRRYEAVVISESGEEYLRQPVAPEVVQRGAMLIELRAPGLVNGDYRAIVEAISAVGDTLRTNYPFTISRPLGR